MNNKIEMELDDAGLAIVGWMSLHENGMVLLIGASMRRLARIHANPR